MNKSLAILLLSLGIISLSDCMARRPAEQRAERCSNGCHVVRDCSKHACMCDKQNSTECRVGKCECKPCGCVQKLGYIEGKKVAKREVHEDHPRLATHYSGRSVSRHTDRY